MWWRSTECSGGRFTRSPNGGCGYLEETVMLDTPGKATLIDVKGVCQSYPRPGSNDLVVLETVDLTLRQGEIVGLLGRSGSGKSTLLRIIAGLTTPSRGEVICHGECVRGPTMGVAMVFQTFALFPWLTVLENVELGLEAMGVEKGERRRRALSGIDLIGLDGFESAYPKELSGGMRQRVGFARALVVHPELLLMDEPFSALDVLTAETLRTDLIDLWVEGRLPIKSILMVTHNIEEAVLMCDRILVFSSNPGRIAAEFKVDMPHPRNRLDPTFRRLVDTVYERMTQRKDVKPGARGGLPGVGIGMALNHVSSNVMSGFIEAIAAPPYNGKADLPHLADDFQMEIDELFPITEALQLLRFAEVEHGDIQLTEAGRRYAQLETDQRKKLTAEHLLAFVPIIGLIRRVLEERPTHRAPASRFREELEDYQSEEAAAQTLKAVVSWSRFAELFAYDDQSQQFTLENPA
jgi:NitT/TauT family transport system ATP-binding protein